MRLPFLAFAWWIAPRANKKARCKMLCHCETSSQTGRGNPFSFDKDTDSHTSDVGHWFGMTGSRIRACKLGIRQPQTGSFRTRHRCLCSEYISSIPAPVASPDTKISLFAVRSSFARGIFRPDDIEKSGNTCCIPGFFCDGWAEKGRAKPVVSLICTPFRSILFLILEAFHGKVN